MMENEQQRDSARGHQSTGEGCGEEKALHVRANMRSLTAFPWSCLRCWNVNFIRGINYLESLKV